MHAQQASPSIPSRMILAWQSRCALLNGTSSVVIIDQSLWIMEGPENNQTPSIAWRAFNTGKGIKNQKFQKNNARNLRKKRNWRSQHSDDSLANIIRSSLTILPPPSRCCGARRKDTQHSPSIAAAGGVVATRGRWMARGKSGYPGTRTRYYSMRKIWTDRVF